MEQYLMLVNRKIQSTKHYEFNDYNYVKCLTHTDKDQKRLQSNRQVCAHCSLKFGKLSKFEKTNLKNPQQYIQTLKSRQAGCLNIQLYY